MSIRFIYPTINVFQYTLRDGLGDDADTLSDRSANFYKQFLPDDDADTLSDRSANFYKQFLPDVDRKLANYQKEERSNVEYYYISNLAKDLKSEGLDAAYYPMQLYDSYALQFKYSGEYKGNFRFKEDTKSKNTDDAFRDLKSKLKNYLSDFDCIFGRTWLLTACVNDYSQIQEISEFVKSCYRQITDREYNLELAAPGDLMGGKLFELWTNPSSYEELSSLDRHPHILVWLFPSDGCDDLDPNSREHKVEETYDLISNTYEDWTRLFYCRHKMLFAYQKSQATTKKLKSSISQIESIYKYLNDSPVSPSLLTLDRGLLDILKIIPAYSRDLLDLKVHQHTFDVNLNNYRLRYEEMVRKNSQSDLLLLTDFSNKYGSKYARQIQIDIAYLDSGLSMLENLTQAIQGLIQIKQTKRDRNTNITIGLSASGLALSQIVAAIVLTQKTYTGKDTTFSNTPFYETSAFQVSLISGSIPIIILFIYLGWNKIKNRRTKGKSDFYH
jgi:hypothetical protein